MLCKIFNVQHYDETQIGQNAWNKKHCCYYYTVNKDVHIVS